MLRMLAGDDAGAAAHVLLLAFAAADVRRPA
jgi:hypothetical protein